MTDKLRWGILGISGIAQEKVLPALAAAKNASVELLGTRDPIRAADIGDHFGVSRGATTYEAVVSDPNIDAIYVSLPNTMHLEWILKSLENGKAVLADKPLTISSAEAELVANKSAETGLPVMEGLMYRFHPQNTYIRKVIAEGEIGEVREVQVYNAFRLIDSLKPDNIRVWDGPGAGALMDMGCYVVSAARMLLDDEPIAASGWLDIDSHYGIDVGCAATLQFSDGRFAPISWSFRTGFGAGYRVIGSQATLEVPIAFIPGQAGQLTETKVIHVDPSGKRTVTKFEPADSFQLEFEGFSSAVLSGGKPPWDAEDAVNNAKALELVKALPQLVH